MINEAALREMAVACDLDMGQARRCADIAEHAVNKAMTSVTDIINLCPPEDVLIVTTLAFRELEHHCSTMISELTTRLLRNLCK